jgi:translin
MDERAAVDEGLPPSALTDIAFASCRTRRRIRGSLRRPSTGLPAPTPEEIGVEDAPYLNGIAEAIGEARRYALDLLRGGRVEEGERVLATMDDLYSILVTMDYPDAITGNLRRSTDVARSLIEKTRGDLSVARVSQDLHDALDRHARDVLGKEE